MTEAEMRERIADLTKQLDEERAKNAKLIDAVADLAMGTPVSLRLIPVPLPHPQPDPYRLLPGVFVAYMAAFAGQNYPTEITTYTGNPPTGDDT